MQPIIQRGLLLKIGIIIFCLPLGSHAKTVIQGAFSYRVAPVPDWVEVIPAEEMGSVEEKKDEGSVRYVLSDQQVNYLDEKKQRYQHYGLVPLTEKGLEDVAEISIDFSPDYHELVFHQLIVHRGDKIIDKLPNAEIKLMQREQDIEKRLYNGMVTAFIVLTDIRVGDLIEYSFSRIGSNPVFGKKNFDYFSLSWAFPVGYASVRVLSSINKALYYRQHRFSEVLQEKKSKLVIERIWERRDVPAVYDEREYPNWFNPYAVLELSEYKSWDEVIKWALPLYSSDKPLSEGIQTHIREWRSSSTDKQAYIEKALRFTQDEIRYFGVEYGQNSHRPSHPNEVYDRRFGDCKDKSLFLVNLLKANGINASPALVSSATSRYVSDTWPSPGAFDHVIVHAKLAGKPLWLDPTLNYQHSRLDSLGVLGYQKALIVSNSDDRLEDIVETNKNSLISIQQEYFIQSYDDPVNLVINTRLYGKEAERIRQHAATTGLEKLDKHYFDYRSRFHPRLEAVKAMVIEDDKDSNILHIKEEYRVPGYLSKEQGQSIAALNADYITQFIKLPTTIKRKMPLGLYHPLRVEQTLIIHYPEDVNWGLDLTPVFISDDVIEYERILKTDSDTVRIEHIYKTKRDYVKTEDVPQHIEKLEKIDNALRYTLVVNSKHDTLSADRDQRLKKMLRSLMNKNKKQD